MRDFLTSDLEVDYNQEMHKCHVQLKEADIHKNLKVWNMIDVIEKIIFFKKSIYWIE